MGRVIARPYLGEKPGEFVRTSNRHDYALKPTGRTVMNVLKDAGFDVISIGKINDIFDGEGVTRAEHSNSSVHGMEQTIQMLGLILQDFVLQILLILMRNGDIAEIRKDMRKKSNDLMKN